MPKRCLKKTKDQDLCPSCWAFTKIPEATKAGVYFVWYKALGEYSDEETEPEHSYSEINTKVLTISAKDQQINNSETNNAFIAYQNEQKKAVDALILTGDTEAAKKLIADAEAAIAALTYDKGKTLAQNKKTVDDIIKQLKTALDAQRESEKKTDHSCEWVDGKWYNKDGTQTYKPIGKWHKNKKGWWYEDTAGWYPKNRWQKIDGKWYYFKKDGYAAEGEYVKGWWLNSKTCQWTYPHKASWHKNRRGWWYGDSSGWYAKNGTYIIDGKSYDFDRYGFLAD